MLDIEVRNAHDKFKEVKIKYDSIEITPGWLNEGESDDLAWLLISAAYDLLTDGKYDNDLKKELLNVIME